MSYSESEYANILQKIYKANVKRINDDEISKTDYIKVALIEAEQIWLNVQVLMKSDKYSQMNDEQKINLIQRDFSEFYKNFPIVSRYMICLGQYKMKAFKRMLIKYDEVSKKDKGKSVEPKKSIEDRRREIREGSAKKESESKQEKLWIERQADYVRFLWEECQQDGFERKDSDSIWQHTYDTLKKEFDDFRDLHKNMEEKTKKDSVKHKKELLYEMSKRIIDGAQSLPDDSAKSLLNKLRDLAYKQRSKKVIKQLLSNASPINPCIEGEGNNEDAKYEYEEELQQAYYKKNFQKMDISKIMQ